MTDEDYQKERNKLIPFAEKYANEKAGKRFRFLTKPLEFKNYNEWAIDWNRIFLGKMDQLARETGLI